MAMTQNQIDLIKWLSDSDYSQLGECDGPVLDSLVRDGIAQIHGPGEHQSSFIAQGTGELYRAVSLTERGRQIARIIR